MNSGSVIVCMLEVVVDIWYGVNVVNLLVYWLVVMVEV